VRVFARQFGAYKQKKDPKVKAGGGSGGGVPPSLGDGAGTKDGKKQKKP